MNQPDLVFIPPHAIQRFRERIRRSLSDDEIRHLIQRGIAEPHSAKHRTLRDGTPSVTVKVKGLVERGVEYSFRLVIVPPEMPGGWPVVGTVLHGTSGLSRGAKLPRRTMSMDR